MRGAKLQQKLDEAFKDIARQGKQLNELEEAKRQLAAQSSKPVETTAFNGVGSIFATHRLITPYSTRTRPCAFMRSLVLVRD